ncbi:hypothetical protein [Micromonospora echinofusca]|uniref:SUKH-3 immunity protein n=1 Tax=Micromonospora echinofusca TaxID=47858 RepID=A0ABS3VWK1_MICEH|nr:hypothetical protein [Micromonospora echinofusca]MBO4208875.1 hypothetical protein [Micromonospora echinofusca]
MGYELSAVIADADLLRGQTADLDHAVLAELRQEMALLPVTPLLVEELTGRLPDFDNEPRSVDRPFHLVLGHDLTRVLAEWSHLGQVGYLEAEFSGGSGYQAATVWLDGRTVWGPTFDDEFTAPRGEWPINGALRRLGVEPGPWIDLFAEVGLHLMPDTDGWLMHGRRGLTPDHYEDLAEEWESRQNPPDKQ